MSGHQSPVKHLQQHADAGITARSDGTGQPQRHLDKASGITNPNVSRRRFVARCSALVAGLLTGSAMSGCATWDKSTDEPEPKSGLELHGYRMPSDSVIVEIALVDAPDDPALLEQIWMKVDENHASPELRKHLALNGFRFGVVHGPIPRELERLLIENRENADIDSETGAFAPGSRVSYQRHQLRTGQTVQIASAANRESLSWIVDEGDYRRGRSCVSAECRFVLRSYPRSDGQVRLKLTPEIHHGDLQPGLDVQTSSLIYRSAKKKEVFTSMEMAANLRAGQVMIVSSSGPDALLGQLFLSRPEGIAETRRKWVLVRLVQTQLDDLFAPGKITNPIETPVE